MSTVKLGVNSIALVLGLVILFQVIAMTEDGLLSVFGYLGLLVYANIAVVAVNAILNVFSEEQPPSMEE